MSALLSQRCSVCSASLSNSLKRQSTTGKRTHPNVSRSIVVQPRVSVLSVEDEYIKQLQEQVYHLENECQYLRAQLNRNTTLANRSHQGEQERLEFQRSLLQASSQIERLSSENHGLTVAFDELRRKFDSEKQNLFDELNTLRRGKEAREEEKRAQDQELQQICDRSRTSVDELKKSQIKVQLLEQQLEQQVNQNKLLNDELRRTKSETSQLQRSLNDYQTRSREKDRLQGTVAELEKETKTLRQQVKVQDSRHNEEELLRTKLTAEKNVLTKELTRLQTLCKESDRQLEELRLTLNERADAFQAKDKELAALRRKEQSFRSDVDSLQAKLDAELIRNQDLDGQLKQLQRQLNIEIQSALAAKRETTEYEEHHLHLQDEVKLLQRDKDHLTGLISTLQQRLTNEESLTNSLRVEMQGLETRVNEIDRLKTLEDLIQSQRWDDITQMAQTMQTVSRTMARATSPVITRRQRMELQ